MVNIGFARHALDIKSFVSLEDIALLANVSERSVRNAMHAEGNERLVTSRNSNGEITVNQQEALHWLRHCHDFKETVWTGSYAKEAIPQILSPTEIIPFIETRLADIYRGWGDGQFRYISGSQSIGWTEDQVKSLAEGSVKDINPDDCKSIARMIRVNPAWFTSQVMNAIFPEAMNQINPHTESIHPTYISPLDQENGTLSVELTDAGIRNGYIDIEIRYAQRFFPSDSFGSRGAGDEGKTVKLDHDGKNSPYITDFRVKTKTLVSPRKRFSAYFTEHKAKAGDVIRFEKIDERHYRLIFIARG